MRSLPVRGPQGPWQPVRRAVDADGVCVVHARLDDWRPADLSAPWLARSLGADHHRLQQLTLRRPRERFAASRLLLRACAAAVLGVAPHELELGHTPGGRPLLRGIGQLEISLSHTADVLVVGLSRRGRVGVDVEAADRRMRGLDTGGRLCTPYELDALDGLPPGRRNRELVRLWTLKEAYSKAIGQGLRFRFSEFGFSVSGGARPVRMVRPDGTPVEGEEWAFHSRPVGRYLVGAAFHDPGYGDPVSGLPPWPSADGPRSRAG